MDAKYEAYIRDRVSSPNYVVFGRDMVITLLAEIDFLRGMVEGLAERVAAQSALLSKRAEREPVTVDEGGDIGDWYEMGGEG